MIEQIKIIRNIIFQPRKAFEDINKKPNWLTIFIILAIGTIIINYLTLPFMMKITKLSISSYISPDEAEKVLETAKRMQIMGIFSSPLLLLIGFLIVALVIWLAVNLFSEVDFKRIFSMVVYCGIIPFFSSVLSLIILEIRGLQSIENAMDIQVSLGLDIFLPKSDLSLPLKMVLSNINVFSIWWVVLIGLGISVISKISKFKSFFIAGFFWLVSNIIKIIFFSSTTNF